MFVIHLYILICYIIINNVISDKIDNADRMASNGNFQVAIQLYHEAITEISKVQDIAYAYSGIGSTYIEMNMHQYAGDAFINAGNTHCKPEYFFNAGLSYTTARAPQDVIIDTYQKCIECKGNIRPCVLKLAAIHQNNDNFSFK